MESSSMSLWVAEVESMVEKAVGGHGGGHGVMIPDVMYYFSYYFLTSFPSKFMLVTLNLFRIWPLFPLV